MDKLIKAIQAPKIQGVITSELSRILTAAYAVTGQKPKDFKQTVHMVERDIHEKFPGMTLPEVSYAIEQGVRGEYTEVTAINVSNIYKWLKGYRQSSDRAMAIRKLQQGLGLKQVAAKGTLTEGEKKDILRKGAIRKFCEYRKTGRLQDFGSSTYNYLAAEGHISLTKERKKEIYAEAVKDLSTEAEMRSKGATSRHERMEAESMIKKILNNGDAAIARAKLMSLRQYYDDLIEMGEELKSVLTT